jgi:hypothetical protein
MFPLVYTLRRITEPKREKTIRGCRRLHSEELHDLRTSLNIIRVIKSRRTRWARHVAHRGEMRIPYKILVRKH